MTSKRILLSSAAVMAGTLLSLGLSQQTVIAAEEGKAKPRIDLAFCIDTTGSMQSEIDAVKTKTKEIVAKLSGSHPTPDIRVGVVAYRDRGDEYVTKVFQFSDNIDQVVKDISSLRADGGGDTPEAVNQALHASVHDLKWSDDKKTVKMLFLIGDAGPHEYPGDYKWETESKNAIAKGIQINTVACEGLDQSAGLNVFQQIAKLADGKCEFLTYRQEIVDAGGKKSTIVASGGKMYKVEGGSGDSWRMGADKLMARAAAAPAAPSPHGSRAVGFASAPSAVAIMDDRPVVSDFRSSSMHSARAKAVRGSLAGFAGGGAAGGGGAATEGYSAVSVSRADSNLADIVLNATKDAAKKKANIEYKD